MRLRRVMYRIIALLFISSVGRVNSYAQTEKQVSQITIKAHWAGLGSAGDNTVVIRRVQGTFRRDGQTIAPSLISTLLNSLNAVPIVAPKTTNLGVTEQWLKAQAPKQHPRAFAQGIEPTQGQISLFNSSFTNLTVIDSVVDRLFQYWRSDDYPAVEVEVTFEDSSKLGAVTTSQYIFMLPWSVSTKDNKTFNADISHAVSALMPNKTANKERLSGSDLAQQLTDAVMSSIEREWNLRGTEELVGDDVSALRTKYQVVTAEINPWHHPEYGTATYKGEPEEKNLHIMVRKSSFPPNVFDSVVLKDANGHIEGIQQFLDTAGQYEDLVLSVPWLSEFIHQNPKVTFDITYVHDASFGDKALRTFTGDMKLREREDLIAQVKSQQHEIALLQAEGAYWLVFPDKHMILWRHQGYRTLLKWTPADFGEGDCSDYKVNNGGCSGREVTPKGQLVPDGKPRDVACVEAWRANHPMSTPPPDSLFGVMENGRGGYIDRSGTIRIPLCFDAVSTFSEGLARFERDGRWGYVDQTGKIVIEPKFPWAEEFHEGLAHVQVTGTVLGYDGRWGYIDKGGQVVIEPTYKRMLSDSDGVESVFSEGLAMVEGDETSIPPKNGFIDKTGKLVIPTRFTYAYPFSEGLAAVTESESGDSGWGYIDKTGNWVIPQQFDWATPFKSGMAAINRKKNCGYIDSSGKYQIHVPGPSGQHDCSSVWGEFNDGLARNLFDTKYGFIDQSGKQTIPPKFDLTDGFSEGLAAVRIGKEWGYIDTTGKLVIQLKDISQAHPFHNGLAEVVTRDGEWGYIDKTGKYVWKPTLQGHQ
jgi:hypothetical protein